MNNKVRAALLTVGVLSGVFGLSYALVSFITWLAPTGSQVMAVVAVGIATWIACILYTILHSHFESVDKSK